MQTFTLHNGSTVTTQRVGSGIEFVTANASGEIISSVTHSYAEAVPLLRTLGGCHRGRA